MAELLAELGSASAEDTLAWLVIVPGADGRTRIWTVAVPWSAIVPSAQVTVPADCEQLPWEGVAESNVTPPGQRVGERHARSRPGDRRCGP